MPPRKSCRAFALTGLPGAALVFFMLSCLPAISFSSPGAAADKSADAGSSSDAGKGNVTKMERYDFDVGDTAKFGKVEIKINTVKRDYVSESSAPSEGYEQVLLNMTLNNTGITGMCIYKTELKINYGGEDFGYNKYVEEIDREGGSGGPDNCLKPKKPITRDVVYEIPAGMRKLKLEYETNQIVAADPDKGTIQYKKTIYTLAF